MHTPNGSKKSKRLGFSRKFIIQAFVDRIHNFFVVQQTTVKLVSGLIINKKIDKLMHGKQASIPTLDRDDFTINQRTLLSWNIKFWHSSNRNI